MLNIMMRRGILLNRQGRITGGCVYIESYGCPLDALATDFNGVFLEELLR